MDEKFYDEFLLTFSNVLDYFTDVTHVVNVLELAWGWEQLFWDFLEHCKGCEDDWFAERTFGGEKTVKDLEGSTRAWSWEH